MNGRHGLPKESGSLSKEKSMLHESFAPARRSGTAPRNMVRAALLMAMSVLFASASALASAADRAYRLTPFSVLELDLPARYVIRNAGAPAALIRGRPEIIERIVVEQHDDRVRIFVPGIASDLGQIVIEIDAVGLAELVVKSAAEVEARGLAGREFKLELPGAANVNLAALDVDKLRVDMEGSGKIEASGRASSERVRIGGAGEYRAANLAADSVDVKLDGVGNVEVMARERLDVRLSGTGTVRYRGTPKLSTRIDGTGSIERM
jgi:hypothetical protein